MAKNNEYDYLKVDKFILNELPKEQINKMLYNKYNVNV